MTKTTTDDIFVYTEAVCKGDDSVELNADLFNDNWDRWHSHLMGASAAVRALGRMDLHDQFVDTALAIIKGSVIEEVDELLGDDDQPDVVY